VIHRTQGDVVIAAPSASAQTPFVQSLTVNGKPHDSPWLPASFAEHGGQLQFTLGAQANKAWGSDIAKAPPSFSPPKS
jgi:putative alpha-1,2-mannosidase